MKVFLLEQLTVFGHYLHYVKSVTLRKKCYFPAFELNTEGLNISPYSVRMRENTDQNNSKCGQFSHSAIFAEKFYHQTSTPQKIKLSITDFFCKCDQIRKKLQEILSGKLHFLCSEIWNSPKICLEFHESCQFFLLQTILFNWFCSLIYS